MRSRLAPLERLIHRFNTAEKQSMREPDAVVNLVYVGMVATPLDGRLYGQEMACCTGSCKKEPPDKALLY